MLLRNLFSFYLLCFLFFSFILPHHPPFVCLFAGFKKQSYPFFRSLQWETWLELPSPPPLAVEGPPTLTFDIANSVAQSSISHCVGSSESSAPKTTDSPRASHWPAYLSRDNYHPPGGLSGCCPSPSCSASITDTTLCLQSRHLPV